MTPIHNTITEDQYLAQLPQYHNYNAIIAARYGQQHTISNYIIATTVKLHLQQRWRNAIP